MSEPNWHISTHSQGSSNCAEVATGTGTVRIRDTKDREYGQVTVSAAVWEEFLDSLVDTP